MKSLSQSRVIVLTALLCASYSSCASFSSSSFSHADLHGMLYNQAGEAVINAHICVQPIDSHSLPTCAYSDIYGKFTLPQLPPDTYNVTVGAHEHAVQTFSCSFLNSTQVLYIPLLSWRDLLSLSLIEIEANRIEQALAYIEEAESISPNKTMIDYFKAAVDFKKGQFDFAQDRLQRTRNQFSADMIMYVDRLCELCIQAVQQ